MTRDEAVGKIVGLALALPDSARKGLTDALYAVMAAVWDEGYLDGNGDGGVACWDPDNPYKKENDK